MDQSILVNDEVHLYGDVGDTWDGGFTANDVAAALAEHGEGDVTVRLNSGGGIATEGMAIYSLLKSHPGKVTIVVDGVAASAASLIFMAGADRRMRDGAMVMIHDPATITVGNVAAHQRNIAVLDKLAENYAGVYARASGKTQVEARTIMKAETWLTANEAKDQGFATEVLSEQSVAKAEFDYRIYAKAPAALPQRLRRRERESLAQAAASTTDVVKASVSAALARMRARERT